MATGIRNGSAEAAALAHELRPAVMKLGRRLRQLRDESLDLGSNQLSAMAVLLNCGDLPMGELAAQEKVRPPSMTRIVNSLQERGYVTRRPDDQDRRQSVVSLTPAGRSVVLDNRRRRDEWLTLRVAQLSPDEQDLLRAAVPVLIKVNQA